MPLNASLVLPSTLIDVETCQIPRLCHVDAYFLLVNLCILDILHYIMYIYLYPVTNPHMAKVGWFLTPFTSSRMFPGHNSEIPNWTPEEGPAGHSVT